jgi:hypothetical protein
VTPLRRARGLIALLLGAMLAGGCAAGLLSGAAAAAKQASPYQRAREQVATDAQTTEEVRRLLRAAPDMQAADIDVATYDGVVYLRGRVATAAQGVQAQRIAHGAPAVLGVRSELVVRPGGP